VTAGKPWRLGLRECYVERLEALKHHYYALCDMRAKLVFRLILLIPACTFRALRQPWDCPRFNGILINVTEH
jgi:hypothetical protein